MAELEEGRVIGSYRVVRCIGQGGMGTVYEVEHVELGVHYALKTFTFDPANDVREALKTKFLEEGKVLARLKHPNIAHVFDLAFDEETQMPYFVMDLVTYEDGESYTAEDVDQNDIDEEVVYGWFKELASALDYIHEQGIVHRDIKPGNLLMDKDAHVILTDFGISRIFGAKLKTDVDATRTMASKTGRGKIVLGTGKYIAPEVERGEEAVPESDAYSLGVMVLRWLTGFFYKDNPGALGLLGQKKYHWLPVIARLLAPTPDRRPKTYSDLVKQLKPFANGRAASMRPPQETAEQKKKRGKTRENIIAGLGGLLVIGVLAAGGYSAWQYVEKKSAKRDRQYAELRQRIEADRAAAAKKEAEEKAEAERKATEEKRIAAEKEAARKARIAERERLEAARVEVPTPNDEPLVDAASSPRQKGSDNTPPKREKMIIVKDEDEPDDDKDYGPIPNVKYKWFAGQGNEKPLRVDFQMSSGAKIELMPMKKGIFYMSNNWDDKKARHKVTLTRPFWVSKFCVTAAQWREFDAGYVADCLPLEKALKGKYPISKKITWHQFDKFCKFMTHKYKSQLPLGYVFRSASEAEWEYALGYESTMAMYARRGENLSQLTGFGGSLSLKQVNEIVRTGNLLETRTWSDCDGWGESKIWFVGGGLPPNINGIFDIPLTKSYMLDRINGLKALTYADEETDPLKYDGVTSWASFLRVKNFDRLMWSFNCKCLVHLVLGPDLIKEKAWNNPRKNIEHNAPVPNRHYAWANPDKVPKLIKRPKELTFKMAEGGDMIFCTIPSVKEFNMSNPDGQDKLYHKVTLTKPFWITKYCVTTKQWREYAKYDCEGIAREVEKYFPKNPIYMSFTRPQWDGFCEYLNRRYGRQLPNGYVFRLPTEAEWEWALVGDKNGDVRKLPSSRFRNEDSRFMQVFESLCKKNKVPKSLPSISTFQTFGELLFLTQVGGLVEPTETFGVCDMAALGYIDSFVLDTFDSDGDDATCCQYEDAETDPIHWAGRLATKLEFRNWGARRSCPNRDVRRGAHIVVGPDIEKQLKKKELDPYPVEDFGGKLLSSVISYGGASVKNPEKWRASPELIKRTLSTENTIVAVVDENRDLRAMATGVDDSPWIQLNLDARHVISGLLIDALSPKAYNFSRHLRVWASEDGKKWREVAAENQRKHRYRFDLQRKNVKAKYIRVGREPGFLKDYFSLDKILVYGKEK